jgi:hypothetical protein
MIRPFLFHPIPCFTLIPLKFGLNAGYANKLNNPILQSFKRSGLLDRFIPNLFPRPHAAALPTRHPLIRQLPEQTPG